MKFRVQFDCILPNILFVIFFAKLKFFSKFFFRKNPNLADPSCGYARRSPPGRGVENARQDPGYPFCGFFSKTNFFEKNCSTMTPPWTPHFFQFFFQFWSTGAPFYIFFFYYITVFPSIFSLFLFTFFSIIECRAVVLQPPQYWIEQAPNVL